MIKKRDAILFSLIVVSAIMIFTLLQKTDTFLQLIYRASGLFAYFFIFLAILSSEYMRQMKNVFGKGFIAVHHILARIGILLMLVHPVAFAIERRSISVFVPVFHPFTDFLELAGRPAFYLILIAVFAALYRKRISGGWKKIHYLIYPAFLLTFAHAWLIGTDLNSGSMQFLWIVMALTVAGIFLHKRVALYRKSKHKKHIE
ncbi:ferric reductase-like transmembrane domain-containing protein [Methanolobus sp. WCC5]|uniref:ferric reductase-like transmembrane domain-containing protein n=1 Tax=Methanolobus sp. WCC5 TaxID=3125785 RepID=UPI0032471358